MVDVVRGRAGALWAPQPPAPLLPVWQDASGDDDVDWLYESFVELRGGYVRNNQPAACVEPPATSSPAPPTGPPAPADAVAGAAGGDARRERERGGADAAATCGEPGALQRATSYDLPVSKQQRDTHRAAGRAAPGAGRKRVAPAVVRHSRDACA
ncbi:MAG: hypothetical protein J3K34DRAFT_429724 [Monoraphidium minutum]|nr:MAG: hypothetical protein J3K34DRAFT_429724 [Monoraphidium minutum]